MNLDRFAYGLPDPQSASVIGYCDACGGEIYEGNEYITLPGSRVIHDNFDCRFDAGLRETEEDDIDGNARKTA